MATMITEAELLEALAATVPGNAPEDARTSRELRQELHVGDHTLRRVLTSLAESGRLRVHRVTRRSFDGRFVPVQAYTVLPKRARKR